MATNVKKTEYRGFEQGPIRPPSESFSLLIRVTRNCPWNRCAFCPVYKEARFSLRPVEHVIRDIDTIHWYVEAIQELGSIDSEENRAKARQLIRSDAPGEKAAWTAAYHWFHFGRLQQVFLQDANSLIMRTTQLEEILKHLRFCFPHITRITSYARAHTLANKTDDELKKLRAAGLDRLHVGLESGSDRVLALVDKGVTKAEHIAAGLRIKQAGIELSEYVMPGLGGKELSQEHATETADVINQVNPDFIRIRSLAIPKKVPLAALQRAGKFTRLTDCEVVAEILCFLEHLSGVTGIVKSDHILNLLGEVEGKLPRDKGRMMRLLEVFLELPEAQQCLFQLGRRLRIMERLRDLDNPERVAAVQKVMADYKITPQNVDAMIDRLVKRFI